MQIYKSYSYWEKKLIERPADFTIIGAGIVGLSTALSLKEINPHSYIKVIERGNSPQGASTKNAGFACFGSITELIEDIQTIGIDDTLALVKMRFDGLNILRNRIGDDILSYQRNGGTELFHKDVNDVVNHALEHLPIINDALHKTINIKNAFRPQKNILLPSFNDTALYNPYEGSIDSGLMMHRLQQLCHINDIDICTHLEVESIQDDTLNIKNSEITIPYKTLVICTNGFTSHLFPQLNVIPGRNQVLITKPIAGLHLPSTYHFHQGYYYFRSIDQRLLLGGGRHIFREEETTDIMQNTTNVQNHLTNFLHNHFSHLPLEIDYWWSGILGLGDQKMPLIQQINAHTWAGVRLGGMGVAIGSYMGVKLAQLVCGKNTD